MIVICGGGGGGKGKSGVGESERNKAFFFLSFFLFRILISQI